MSMMSFAEPLLGGASEKLEKLKVPSVEGWKAGAGITLALCVLIVGAMSFPPSHTLTSVPTTQNIPSVVENKALEAGAAKMMLALPGNVSQLPAASKEVAGMSSPAFLQPVAEKASELDAVPAGGDDDNKAMDESLKEAQRELTGVKGATWCVAALLFDRDAPTACKSASPMVVEGVTVVLALYILFGFAPFYLFPEAFMAFGAWKVFPLLGKDFVASANADDAEVLHKMRTGLLITTVVAFLARLFTLWTERNEKQAAGRQGSMLTSLVVAAVIYMILNFLSERS